VSDTARGWRWRALSALGFLGLTGVLVLVRGSLQLESILLLYVLLIVLVALVTGVGAALLCAVAAALAANYYFVQPLHTLRIASRDDVVTLVVFALVGGLVSVAAELAARQRARSAELATETRLLAAAASSPAAQSDPAELLEAIRSSFGYDSVSLERGRVVVAAAGTPGPLRGRRIDLGPDAALFVDGPERLGEDHARLVRLGTAALRAVESRELADVDRARSALLAAVGHDLRTPIAGIAAAASGLREPELSGADRAELLDTVAAGAERLGALVDNLLDASRLRAGVLAASCVPISLEEVVPRALGPRAAVPDLAALPHVLADPGMLERVLSNLLDNVERHAGRAAPWELKVHTEGSRVLLAVVDHGPGVADGAGDQLFAPFQRLDDTSPVGLGLGLSVARGFMEAMGGSLTATDTPGGGLTMTIALRQAS
jgi:two-component system sensor histidine kinase KdpD